MFFTRAKRGYFVKTIFAEEDTQIDVFLDPKKTIHECTYSHFRELHKIINMHLGKYTRFAYLIV